MPILNTQVNNIGESGQIPTFIYINTNDTVADVTTAGFLNNIVSQGLPISQVNMALVTTSATPNSVQTTGLYTISFAGGDWTLIPITMSMGTSWNVVGNAITGGILGTTGATSWQTIQDGVPMETYGTGQTYSLLGSTISITGATSALLNGAALTIASTSTALAIGSAACTTTLDGTHLNIPNLPNTTSANILYYNSGTHALSYGAPAAIPAAWLLSGNSGTGGTAILGTLDGAGYQFQVGGSQWLEITDTGNLTIAVNNGTFDGSAVINIANSMATGLFISNTTCTTSFDATALSFPNLPPLSGLTSAAVGPNAPSTVQPADHGTVIINTTTGQLSYYIQV